MSNVISIVHMEMAHWLRAQVLGRCRYVVLVQRAEDDVEQDVEEWALGAGVDAYTLADAIVAKAVDAWRSAGNRVVFGIFSWLDDAVHFDRKLFRITGSQGPTPSLAIRVMSGGPLARQLTHYDGLLERMALDARLQVAALEAAEVPSPLRLVGPADVRAARPLRTPRHRTSSSPVRRPRRS